MERRNFLKSLLGVVVVPSICTAKLSKHTGSKDADINFDNIKINGTFDEWVESIRAEVKRLLKPTNKGDEVYWVCVRNSYWGNDSIPAKTITIKDKYKEFGHFSLARMEFNKYAKQRKKYLTNLVEVRFNSMQWDINDSLIERVYLLKRFDPKYKVGQYA